MFLAQIQGSLRLLSAGNCDPEGKSGTKHIKNTP